MAIAEDFALILQSWKLSELVLNCLFSAKLSWIIVTAAYLTWPTVLEATLTM